MLGTDIAAHHWSPLECDKFQPGLASVPLCLNRHVAKSHLSTGNLDLKVKGSFQVWLVKAWEGSARITGLKLSAQHVVEISLLGGVRGRLYHGLVLGTVESRHGIVHGPGEIDRQDNISGSDFLWEFERHPLRLLVIGYVRRLCQLIP